MFDAGIQSVNNTLLIHLATTGSTRKEGYNLFNEAINTFYLWLYRVGHMVKDYSDSEIGKPSSATTWATLFV